MVSIFLLFGIVFSIGNKVMDLSTKHGAGAASCFCTVSGKDLISSVQVPNARTVFKTLPSSRN